MDGLLKGWACGNIWLHKKQPEKGFLWSSVWLSYSVLLSSLKKKKKEFKKKSHSGIYFTSASTLSIMLFIKDKSIFLSLDVKFEKKLHYKMGSSYWH